MKEQQFVIKIFYCFSKYTASPKKFTKLASTKHELHDMTSVVKNRYEHNIRKQNYII